jgi:hypothetical protein
MDDDELMRQLRAELPAEHADKVASSKRSFIAFPLNWSDRLVGAGASGALLRLALVLLRRVYVISPRPISVTDALLGEAHVDRRRKRELVGALEGLGLIQVLEWPAHKSPRIRLQSLHRPRSTS